MLIRCIGAEWLKLRRSRLWLILVSLPAFSMLIGCANFANNLGVLQNEWYSLWTQVSLFYGEFFLPILIAICCAYLCRLEHLNKNWHLLLTAPVPVAYPFIAKLTVTAVLLGFVQGLFALLFIGAGIAFGFGYEPPAELAGWIVRGWFAAVAIGAVQLLLSMRMQSFAAPIGIGLCAVFVGFGLYVAKLGLLFPHSLLTLGMGVLDQQALPAAKLGPFYAMTSAYIILVSALAIRRLRTADAAA